MHAQQAIDELYTLARKESRQSAGHHGKVGSVGSISVDGPPIPNGTRNSTLWKIGGRLHDGTRTEEHLFSDLMAINVARCQPGPLDAEEVSDIAHRVHKKDPCRPGARVSPEVDEVLKAAGAYWYTKLLYKGGQSKLRDTYRAHIHFAGKHGKLVNIRVNGEARRAVRYNASTRQLAPVANTSPMSVSRNTKRLKVVGAMRGDLRQTEEDGATFLIVEPAAQNCYTPPGDDVLASTQQDGCNTFARGGEPPRPDHLKTPAPRWRDPVGNARAGSLYVLEAFGQQTEDEIAKRLGIKRPRDLRRRHLEPLLGLGLVERHGDVWCLPGAYVERTAEVRQTPYTLARKVKYRTPEGRVVTEVVYDVEASVEERNQADKESYARDTIDFREYLEGKRKRDKGTRFTDEDMHSRKPHPMEDLHHVEEPPEDLVNAIRQRPWLREHPLTWTAIYLWSEEIVPYKPTADQVEVALYEVVHHPHEDVA